MARTSSIGFLVVVVAGWLATASPAAAQSPRAGGPAPGDDPSSRIAAELAATGNLARGFVDRDLISTRGILQGWDGPWGLYIQPYWMYGRVGTPMGKLTTDNEIYVRTGLFRALGHSVYAYAVDAYDRSLRRKIDQRNLIGAGVGLDLTKRKGISLLASAGVLGEIAAYDGTQFDGGAAIEGVRAVARWSIRLYGRYKLGGGRLALVHDLIVIPAFRSPVDDYRILFYGAIDAPIAKGFSARVQADATREGLIVDGTKHDDLVVTFGVSYRGEWARKPPEPAPPPAARPATPAPATPKPAPAP